MSTPAVSTLDEAAARRVLMVQAYEAGPADDPLWTAADRAWATRLARETAPAGTGAARFIDLRARHALQRLMPRQPALHRALERRLWHGGHVLLALLLGAALGLAVDAVGGSQHINLLAPPMWAVVAWNLVVYLALAWAALPASSARWPQRLRGWLARRLAGPSPSRKAGAPLIAFSSAWSRLSAPLTTARAALLLHVAAAALALGLIGGLYLRGLVLDYRAGWQSTVLDAAQVRAALALLLAPASARTGIAVPEATAMQALRVAPGVAPVAPAAVWIHLLAATLALTVVLPRLLLAAAAAWRAWRLSRALALPLSAPYFQRLLAERSGATPHVQVLPLGTAPSPQAVAGLRAALAAGLGERLILDLASVTVYGDEEAAPPTPAAGTMLRLVLADLAATPEDDSHGRFVETLREAVFADGTEAPPLLWLADEAAWHLRFAALPARLAERRTVWQRWAAARGVAFCSVDLSAADAAAAASAVQPALQAALQATLQPASGTALQTALKPVPQSARPAVPPSSPRA